MNREAVLLTVDSLLKTIDEVQVAIETVTARLDGHLDGFHAVQFDEFDEFDEFEDLPDGPELRPLEPEVLEVGGPAFEEQMTLFEHAHRLLGDHIHELISMKSEDTGSHELAYAALATAAADARALWADRSEGAVAALTRGVEDAKAAAAAVQMAIEARLRTLREAATEAIVALEALDASVWQAASVGAQRGALSVADELSAADPVAAGRGCIAIVDRCGVVTKGLASLTDTGSQLAAKLKVFGDMVQRYRAVPGTPSDPSHAETLATLRDEVENLPKIADLEQAITMQEQLVTRVMAAQELVRTATVASTKLAEGREALDTIRTRNVAPKYMGWNRLKSRMGTQSFERDITRPVAAFLREISPAVTRGEVITEAQLTQLLLLQSTLDEEREDHNLKAEEAERGGARQRWQQAKASVCRDLSEALEAILKANVPDEMQPYRTALRNTDKDLNRLSARIQAIAKVNEDGAQGLSDKLVLQRQRRATITAKVEADQDYPAGTTQLGEFLESLKVLDGEILALPGLNTLLDKAVDDIGAKASTEEVDFVKTAMQMRYGIDVLEGDIGRTNSIAFYKVLGMVPDSHTLTNESLKKIVRKRSLKDMTSWYKGNEQSISINAVRSSGGLKFLGDLGGKATLKNVKAGKKYSAFNWVTLHEIGHAVDDAENFMGQSMQAFGGWEEVLNIHKVMAAELARSFEGYPGLFLTRYVDMLIQGENSTAKSDLLKVWTKQIDAAGETEKISRDADVIEADRLVRAYQEAPSNETSDAITAKLAALKPKSKAERLRGGSDTSEMCRAMLMRKLTAEAALGARRAEVGTITDVSVRPNWTALAKHDISKWVRAATIKHNKSSWEKAFRYPINNVVYQEAYEGKWWSYELGARASRVSNYQFRAPGEYFAEAYAAFFHEKLRDDNPLYESLRRLQQKSRLSKTPDAAAEGAV